VPLRGVLRALLMHWAVFVPWRPPRSRLSAMTCPAAFGAFSITRLRVSSFAASAACARGRAAAARAERSGQFRPAEASLVQRTVRLLENDREGTVAVIRGLIASARSQILFVDPYLDADDLQEFATAASYQGVAGRGLINPRPGRNRRADANGELFGEQMLEKIAAFRDPAQEFGDIDIRVSKTRRLHDRFLQVDDMVWHSGHSFNQMGKGEISLITRVAQPAETRDVLAEAFAEAEPFETYWANRPILHCSLRQRIGYLLRRLAKWIEQPRDAQPQETDDD
jgi:hypothetical protein